MRSPRTVLNAVVYVLHEKELEDISNIYTVSITIFNFPLNCYTMELKNILI